MKLAETFFTPLMYWRADLVSLPLLGHLQPGTLSLTVRMAAMAGTPAANMNRPVKNTLRKLLLFNMAILLIPCGLLA